MLQQGYVHIYTGNGKGKTTAAFGLALRALGHGLHTYIGQFMKGQEYGEILALKGHPYIRIEQFGDPQCLLRKEDAQETHRRQAQEGLQRCLDVMLNEPVQLVVLDEILVALWFELLPESQVLDFLRQRPEAIEVALTGRYASETLIQHADLVTEMVCRKHYYEQGVLARDGIER